MNVPKPPPIPSKSDPLNPSEELKLTPEESMQSNPALVAQYPALAAYNSRKTYDPVESSMPYSAGSFARPHLQALSRGASSLFNHGTIPSALLGGAAGFATGWLGDRIAGLFGADPGLAWKLGLLGGGLGGYSGHLRSKAAAHKDSVASIAQMLAEDVDVSAYEKSKMMSFIRQQSEADRAQILNQVRMLGSVGISAVIAKKMMGANLVLMALAGLAGGSASDYLANTNVAGRRIKPAVF